MAMGGLKYDTIRTNVLEKILSKNGERPQLSTMDVTLLSSHHITGLQSVRMYPKQKNITSWFKSITGLYFDGAQNEKVDHP